MAEKKKKKLTGIAALLERTRNFLDENTFGGPEARVNYLAPHSEWVNGRPPANPQGAGLGTMLVGQSPEEIQRWTEGNSPFMGKPSSEGAPVIRSIPGRSGNIASDAFRFKEGRIQPTADTAFLGADLAGLAGLATRGVRTGVQKAYPSLNPEVNTSRREFLGNTGKIAAGAAAAAAIPAAIRGAEHAAPIVDRAVAPIAARGAARAVTHATIADYYAARKLAQDRAERVAYEIDGDNAHLNPAEVYEETLKQEMDKLYENPAFEPYREHMDMERAHNDGMREAYNDYMVDNDFARLDNTYQDMFEKRDTNNYEFEKKHGAAIDHGEESWSRAADPEYEFVDPKTHIRYVWAKVDEATGKMVQVDPRLEPDAFKAQMMPHSKEIFHYGYSGRRSEVPASYYEEYLKGRGHKLAKGGVVTMPNNYRAGGRVRMI